MPMSKLLGEERRNYLLNLLKTEQKPLTGTYLAEQTGVSRQVIVQDIALLKAKNEPIVATPQGYLYLRSPSSQPTRRVIACQHTFEQTERELMILVEHGVKVIDVIVEHPIYGQIQGSLMLEAKKDVHDFMQKVRNNQAKLLSSLTEGIHLHTVEANDDKRIDEACRALEAEGILLKKD
ncbi:transcriptional regulator [Caldalkalibacillus thermarum]|nr:transcriptional regulator [Caldalkalibacillus thermarum]